MRSSPIRSPLRQFSRSFLRELSASSNANTTFYWTFEDSTYTPGNSGFGVGVEDSWTDVVHQQDLFNFLSNGPALRTPGIIGTGLFHDIQRTSSGATRGVTSVPITPGIPAKHGFSMTGWVKMLASATDGSSFNFAVQTGGPLGANNTRYQIRFTASDISVPSPAQAVASILFGPLSSSNNAPIVASVSAPFPSLNVWHFYAMTYNFVAKELKMYVDGNLVGRATATQALPEANAVSVGTQNEFASNLQLDFDEFGVWTEEAISDAEVTHMWNGGTGARPQDITP